MADDSSRDENSPASHRSSVWAADRGQAVWIGALLLLFVAIATLTLYQVTIVPQHNKEVEAAHHARVTQDLQQFRRAVFYAGQNNARYPTVVDLGPSYPPRVLALNPAEPAGTLRTTTAGEISLQMDGAAVNISALCEYGSRTVRTRTVLYRPHYTYYPGGTLAYENTVLYRSVNGSLVVTESPRGLVEGTHIQMYPIAGNYSQAATQTVSIDAVGRAGGNRTVRPNQSLSLSVPSRLAASTWESTLLAEESTVTDVTQPRSNRVRIHFDPAANYTVSCQPVGLNEPPPT